MRTAFAAALASLAALPASASVSVHINVMIQLSLRDIHARTTTAMPARTIITNTGSEPLKLLNDPRTVLSNAETETFTITGVKGSPDFKGIKVKYSPEAVVKENNPSSFTVLKPGQSHEVKHDLSRAYDFATGPGEYEIAARDTLFYVDSSGKLVSLKATTEPAVLKLGKNIASKRDFRPRGSSSRIRQNTLGFEGCSQDQETNITAAIPIAEAYVADALENLQGASTGSNRYVSWFGDFDSARSETVKSHFQKIQGKSGGTTYDCSTCDKEDVFAYVFPDQPGEVYLCPAFWKAPLQGTDSKAGTLVHEQSHFTQNGGTDDHAYGQSDCHDLAQNYPEMAVMNADNHEYFAENTPSEA